MTIKNVAHAATKRKKKATNGSGRDPIQQAKIDGAMLALGAVESVAAERSKLPTTHHDPDIAKTTFVRVSVHELAQVAGLLEFGPDPFVLATDTIVRAAELCRLLEAAVTGGGDLGDEVGTLLASQCYRFTALADLLTDLKDRVVP